MTPQDKKKAPVIWITWDEVHLDTLGCYDAGTHQTPHIDAFAAASHRFDNAFTNSPVCLPARCSLATGLMPHHSTAMSNRFGASLRLDIPNVFRLMGQQAYETAMVGKCHFTPVPYSYVHPKLTREGEHIMAYYRALGMDVLELQDGNAVSAWFYDDYAKEMESKGLLTDYRKAVHDKSNGCIFPFTGPDDMHPDRWVANQAIDYIKDAPDQAFIWISFSGPHYPINTPESYLDKVDLSKLPPRKLQEGEWDDSSKLHALSYHGPGVTEGSSHAPGGAQKHFDQAYWDRWQRGYRANVVLLDDCFGDILQAVRQRWGHDALIIFTSDHGDMAGHHGIWAKNETSYDDVLRIPMMVQAPGQQQGVIHDEFVCTVDVLPTTLAESCGTDLPCDGQNMLAQTAQRDHILSVKDQVVCIRNKSHKLIHSRHDGKDYREMYDPLKDPNEFTNVYSDPAYEDIRSSMERELQQDPQLLSSVFYDGEGKPYWLAPPHPERKMNT